MYEDGEGTEKDLTKALYWYEKVAEQDNADVQYYVGDMYFTGKGTKEDHFKARYWYEKAAAQGQPEALFNLGVLYRNGDGGLKKDSKKAIELFKKGCEAGIQHEICLKFMNKQNVN